MQQTTDNLATSLAGMLTDYLDNTRANSHSGGRKIDAETDMVTALQLDSFQVMEFMLEVEDHFDVVIDQESLSNTRTIRDLADVVIAALKDG